ncbi:PREDICTED: BRCT domain-containing protein At4g02110-like [Camelina sativa]|uniref:BRCT domain-containing protein At4g02110-like n=1 Tax=Camelina sativa TaxID=90675 RepID=A0ABM0TDD1_CAMSA|nr:PREDICTED: BRCT domain-containing protein At4g02110-like [Camelina sativa]
MQESGFNPKTFLGVRFALVGFNPTHGNSLRSKLVSGGGVDVGQCSQSCTHLIVDKLVYDDPICVAARSSGKVVVTGSWVDHSFDTGMLVHANSVLYRPLRDLNGVPGSKTLVVCLTGYQGQDREDIMAMVDLMGGHFSKPLVANRVTHLICYKFEGEKYELAKRMKRIKVVNHRWLEDCLKNWKLLPEVEYEISGQNGSLQMDDKGLKALTSFSISASKSGSSLERKTLFNDLDKVDKLHGGESPSVVPQAQFTDGSVSSNDSQKVHHNSEASIPPPTSLLLQELRPSSPDENNLRPVTSINDPAESGEFGHKSPDTKLLSSNVVHMVDALSTAENIISNCARDEIQERSLTEPMVGNVLFHEPISGSPKQNLRVVPNLSDHAGGREAADKLDLSDSAARLFNSGVVPMEADILIPENSTMKGALDEVPERSVTEPLMKTSPGSGLIGLKDKQETELPKKKTAPKKSLGIRGRKKNSINQKGSIYLSEPTPKDEPDDCLNKGKVSAPVTANSIQKELSSPGLNTEVVPEMAKHIVSETEAFQGIDSLDNRSLVPEEKDHLGLDLMVNQGKLQAKTPEEVDVDVETKVLTPELTDVPVEDPSDSLQLEVGKIKSKRIREATVCKNSLQSGKKESSSTVEVGKSSVKKTKKSKKEHDTEAIGTLMKDIGDNSADDKDNLALERKSAKVSSGGDQGPVEGETLGRKEGATKDPSDAEVRSEVDTNKGKRRKEAIAEENRLQKPSVKKAKNSRKEDGAKANNTVMNDTWNSSAEVQENVAVDNKSGDVSSDGAQSLVAGKLLARKESAAKDSSNAAMQLEVDKNKAIVERSSLQSGKIGSSATVEVGKSSVKKTKKSKKGSGAKTTDTVMNDIGDDSAKEKENIAADNKSGKVGSGGEQSPVSGKALARKKVAKSATTGTKVDKESKQLRVKPLASRNVLQDQEHEPKFFIVSGPRSQRNQYQQIIRRLKGKCCRDSHQWSYQATHFIAPEIRRTEKFFAAAASGSWILKTDYVADSKEAGKLLPEEPYEWHSTGLSADGAINLESPRKWRLVREQTGHGALYGVRIVVYGDCTIPSLDTLKRAVKAGDGMILATAPPYTRFLNQNTDFALISPGIPRDDVWIQEFIRHEIPCVLSDYLVEYVCKPGYALDKHVLYNTNSWAERSFNKMQLSADVCTI